MKKHHDAFKRYGLLLAFVTVCAFLLPIESGHCAQVKLAWDENASNNNDPNQIRYRVYQRQAGQSFSYQNPAWDGGPETTCTLTLPNPTQTTTYYFVARAYYLSDPAVESVDSAPIAHTIVVNPTLTGLSISGPSAVNENSAAVYTATASWSNGSTSAVSPAWSLSSTAYATVSSGGGLTTGAVSANQSVTLTASFTSGGVNRTATWGVTIVDVPAPVMLTGLSISGPSTVNENSTAAYSATASWSNGSTSAVSPAWSLSSTAYATVSSGGGLTTGAVSANQSVTLTASFTSGGVNRTATWGVTIVDVPAPVMLTGLSISGPSTVNENSTAAYSATASWSNGSTSAVSPAWSLSSTAYATVSSGGGLTTGAVSANQSVTLTASYTSGGVTRTAGAGITVVDVPGDPGGTTNDNATSSTPPAVDSVDEASYYSLHLEPTLMTYRDASGDYQLETRAGFRYVHDYTDPKVLCGSETGPCPATERTVALRALNKYISRFKVYVPPGSTYLQIMLYLPKLGQVATVSRFGQPPTGDYSEFTYADFPIDSDAGATLAQLQAGDYITRNSGGHTTLINQYSPKAPPGGGWLYVRVFAFDASVPIENRYTLRVGLPEYQAWFQTMNQTLGWDTFGETGGYVVAGVSDDSGYASDTGLGGGGTYTPPPTSYSYTSNTAPSSGGTSGSTSNLNNLNSAAPTTALAFDARGLDQIDLETVAYTPGQPLESLQLLNVQTAADGAVDCYAGVLTADGRLYFASLDPLNRIVFTEYAGGPLPSFASGALELSKDRSWTCNAFADFDPAEAASLSYLFGFAPAGRLEAFQGAFFRLDTGGAPADTGGATDTNSLSSVSAGASFSFQSRGLGEIVVETLGSGPEETLGTLQLRNIDPAPEGEVDCYAGVVTGSGTPFFASRDPLGRIVFSQYAGGPLPSFESGLLKLTESTTWECDAFAGFSLGTEAASFTFLFGFAPAGQLEGFQGAVFSFVQ